MFRFRRKRPRSVAQAVKQEAGAQSVLESLVADGLAARSARDQDEGVEFVRQRVDDISESLVKLGQAAWIIGGSVSGASFARLASARMAFLSYASIAQHVHRKLIDIERRGRRKYQLDAANQILAYAFLIGEEVFQLGSSGYPAGAEARVRSLYELYVIMRTIKSSPSVVAERYLSTHIVEIWRRYESGHFPVLNDDTSEASDLRRRLAASYQKIVDKFGDEMRQAYGWAVPAIGHRGVRFEQLDARYGSVAMAGKYEFASEHIHAVHLGTLRALLTEADDIFILGPRVTGNVEPMIDALWLLNEIFWAAMRIAKRAVRDRSLAYWDEIVQFAADICFDALRDAGASESEMERYSYVPGAATGFRQH